VSTINIQRVVQLRRSWSSDLLSKTK